jgi:hypothetical protein
MPDPRAQTHTIPFPGAADLSLRPFGLFAEDLAVDFHRWPRPRIITEILACCCRDRNGRLPDRAFFWDLTISDRIGCLVAIASGAGEVLAIAFRCPNEACGEQLEVEIDRETIAELEREIDRTQPVIVEVDGRKLCLRRPTGKDQMSWLDQVFPDEKAAIKAMIRSLLRNGHGYDEGELDILDDWIETIDLAMKRFDPLVYFTATIRCPACDHEATHAIDLEQVSLQKLSRASEGLLAQVHKLASRYHWTEQEILALPPSRRAAYIRLIEEREV